MDCFGKLSVQKERIVTSNFVMTKFNIPIVLNLDNDDYIF